jgi:hypothetical protein
LIEFDLRMISRLLIGALVLPLAMAVFGFFLLCSSPEPSGVDGYFYLKQIKSLANDNYFYFQDWSLAFLPPIFLAKLGCTPLNAFRVAQALTWAGLLGLLALWGSQFTFSDDEPPQMRIYAYVLTFVASLVFLPFIELTLEYYKTLFATVLLCAGAYLIFISVYNRRLCQSLGCLLIVLALLSHKSVFLFLGAGGLVWIIGRFSTRRAMIFFASGTVLAGLFLLFYSKAAAYAVALLSFFQSPGQWFDWLKYSSLNSPDRIGLYLLVAGFLVSWGKLRPGIASGRKILLDTLALTALLALHPFQVHTPDGPAYRILLMLPVLILPFAVSLALRLPRYRPQAAAVLGLVYVTFLFSPNQPPRHIYNWSQMENDVRAITAHVHPNDYLIVHHGLEFYVDYITDIRARQFVNSDNDKTVFRIAYIPPNRPDGEARVALEEVLLLAVGADYGLFREEDWQQLTYLFDILPNWKNPVEMKPAHIY